MRIFYSTKLEWMGFSTASVVSGHSPIADPRGSRIVNSLYSPTLLSTAMLPPCYCVTMS